MSEIATVRVNKSGPKTPLPVDDALERRRDAIASGALYTPSADDSNAIGLYVMAQIDHAGRSLQDLKRELAVEGQEPSDRTVYRWLAKGRAITASPADANQYRWLIVSMLEQLHQMAVEEKDIKEARNALMDMARTLGIVSTGGNAPTVNVGVQVGQIGEDDLRSEMREWMARNTIEGQVVEEAS